MIDSGRIDIDIGWDGERVQRVRVMSSRPQVARALIGRPVAEALALVPLLFSLCGRAQALCARVAAAAIGAAAQVERDDAHAALAAEMAFEHLWRIWIDWPALFGLPTDRPALVASAAALRTCSTRLGALAAGAALGQAMERIRSHDAPALFAALEAVELRGAMQAGVAPLPYAGIAELQAGLPVGLDAAFAQTPTWRGAPAETGAITVHAHDARVADRVQDGGDVAARLAARLVALERCLDVLHGAQPQHPWIESVCIGGDQALARVDTARGVLMHRLRVEDGRIADYAIVAPTEWNFHPHGALVAALEGCAVRDEGALLGHAQAWVLALDPCVERGVSVRRVQH